MESSLDRLCRTTVGFPFPTAAPEIAALLDSPGPKHFVKSRDGREQLAQRKSEQGVGQSRWGFLNCSPFGVISLGYLISLETRVLIMQKYTGSRESISRLPCTVGS